MVPADEKPRLEVAIGRDMPLVIHSRTLGPILPVLLWKKGAVLPLTASDSGVFFFGVGWGGWLGCE